MPSASFLFILHLPSKINDNQMSGCLQLQSNNVTFSPSLFYMIVVATLMQQLCNTVTLDVHYLNYMKNKPIPHYLCHLPMHRPAACGACVWCLWCTQVPCVSHITQII
ncbi:hypothetical protein O6H91_Y522200 [Diphasiastrum complanatum]|nr:hypothetical protein O6H91_Y522200 [Diphasiastrum complanatum]